LRHGLRISGLLPAPIVNGERDSFWKWPGFQLCRTRDLDLDLGSGHTAYRRASLIDLYLYVPNFIEIEETFVDGRTYVYTHARTDGHLRPALLCRLCRSVNLIIQLLLFITRCRLECLLSVTSADLRYTVSDNMTSSWACDLL